MDQFPIDIKLAATVYVTADSEEAARALAEAHLGALTAFEVGSRDIVLGEGVTLSPAMTSYGAWDGDPQDSASREFRLAHAGRQFVILPQYWSPDGKPDDPEALGPRMDHTVRVEDADTFAIYAVSRDSDGTEIESWIADEHDMSRARDFITSGRAEAEARANGVWQHED